jgi:hypothetical protein
MSDLKNNSEVITVQPTPNNIVIFTNVVKEFWGFGRSGVLELIILFIIFIWKRKLEILIESVRDKYDLLSAKNKKKLSIESQNAIQDLLNQIHIRYRSRSVFIIEFHNGQVTGNGKCFQKFSVTYETAHANVPVKLYREIHDVPVTILVKELRELEQNRFVQLIDLNLPLHIEEHVKIYLFKIDSDNIYNGVIGICHDDRDDTAEFEGIHVYQNKIKLLMLED